MDNKIFRDKTYMEYISNLKKFTLDIDQYINVLEGIRNQLSSIDQDDFVSMSMYEYETDRYDLNLLKDKLNTLLKTLQMKGNITKNKRILSTETFNYKNISIASPITFIISNITLIILLFLFMNKE